MLATVDALDHGGHHGDCRMTTDRPDRDPAASSESLTVEPLTPGPGPAPLAPPAGSPAEAPDAVAYSSRTPGPSKMRVGAVAGAAAVLALGAVATSFAASPSPTTAPGTNIPTTGAVPFAPTGPGLDGDIELERAASVDTPSGTSRSPRSAAPASRSRPTMAGPARSR